MKKELLGRQCVVTNTKNGIYYGTISDVNFKEEYVVLTNARHCFSFNAHPATKGTWGLAMGGPSEGSRVGPVLPMLVITNLANIAPCTEQAIAAWDAAVWD